MNSHNQISWPHPGARWWKFDFHTHTPASLDTRSWQRNNGTADELTPERWLLQYMAAGIDCVAVTDHNTGAWIDRLKSAYKKMNQQAEQGTPPDGFRELTLFPGVEISVNGGFHLLAIFDPGKSTRSINNLLASVCYKGTEGDCDGVTEKSPIDVFRTILNSGGIPIPAHADQNKGLLRVRPESLKSELDMNTIKQVVDEKELLAVEWIDTKNSVPSIAEGKMKLISRILGSDSHSFQHRNGPGSRFTWVKMANPTLDGLRLALLDGNGVSIRRSDEGEFNPFQTPPHYISCIEIKSARYMGNGNQEQLNLTPCYNALIGGRGTGKSTVVNALRLVYQRGDELRRLGEQTESNRRFESFSKLMDDHGNDGALRDNTEIHIVVHNDDTQNRLIWRQDGKSAVTSVQELSEDGEWQNSSSQTLKSERFPVRLLSQGQIAEMAGGGRQALLDVIDEATGASELHRNLADEKQTYFLQRAQLRQMDGRLKERPELQRKLDELNRKLEAIAQSDHSEILKLHQKSVTQSKELGALFEQLKEMPERFDSLVKDLILDDWPEGIFDPEKDQTVISWRNQADQILIEMRKEITKIKNSLVRYIRILDADNRIEEWRQSLNRHKAEYLQLQSDMAKRGIVGAKEFENFVRSRQQLENQLKELERLQQDRDKLFEQNERQWTKVLETRKLITKARKEFVQSTLKNNDFVRIEVAAFGFDHKNIEHSLRNLLECQDDRFTDDFLLLNDEIPVGGLVAELVHSSSEKREDVLEHIKQRLILVDENFGGRFRNFLKRKFDRPEFADYIKCWFPDDDLHVQYSRNGGGDDWVSITQGSQGQRSAALLAFLLAFGNEPLVLDQPEDDLDNHLIYDLIVRQIRENKLRRQLIIVTHNPNIVVNGDAEMVHAFQFRQGQCQVVKFGAFQDRLIREEVCQVMEGGREAFSRRWARVGREI